MNESSTKKVTIWLLSGCFVIFAMVVIGGITRLTGSGLSITEWNVIMGAIPPLNAQQWQEAFDKYKTIPQYQLLNYDFTLSDFKNIFMWEYLHRLIGRLLGVVFLLPFAWFLITKQLDRTMIRKSLFLFALGGLQGFLGWYMVSSGLTERTSVSPYRLAIHLITAFLTYGFTLWFALELIYKDNRELVVGSKENGRSPHSLLPTRYSLVKLISILVTFQIIYGAFVAGNHAGKIANTWPTMDGAWIPGGMMSMNPWWKNFFENLLTVQFIHRTMALMVVCLSVWLWIVSGKAIKKTDAQASSNLIKGINFLMIAILVQFVLGVLTLLTKVQIALAAFHQIGAFMLFSACVFLVFQFKTGERILKATP